MGAVVLLAAVAGAGVGGGTALFVRTLRAGDSAATPWRSSRIRPERVAHVIHGRAVRAISAGLAVGVVTRWPVAAIAAAVLVLIWPLVAGSVRANRRAIAWLEAFAVWVESLRDTTSATAGLEQAIAVSAATAPPLIQPQVARLDTRMRMGDSVTDALRAFGDELDDPSGDIVVAVLLSAADVRGPGLAAELGRLAALARAQVIARREIDAGQRGTLRSVRIVVGVFVAFAALLTLFGRAQLSPYDRAGGQLALAFILTVACSALAWIRARARIQLPGRFLPSSPVRWRWFA